MIWSVLALDPGVTTGWAWACVSAKELKAADPLLLLTAVNQGGRFTMGRFTMGQFTGPVTDTALYVHGLAGAFDEGLMECWPGMRYAKLLVMEGFVMSPSAKRSNSRYPEQVMSAVRQQCLGSFDEEHEQMPSAKAVVNNDRLERHGLWVPGKPHAMDAVRHLVVRLRMLS